MFGLFREATAAWVGTLVIDAKGGVVAVAVGLDDLDKSLKGFVGSVLPKPFSLREVVGSLLVIWMEGADARSTVI